MVRVRPLRVCLLVLLVTACDDPDPLRPDASRLDAASPADAADDGGPVIRNGCPIHPDPLAAPGDPIDGDTWDTFAMGFFEAWCTRCHSTALAGTARRGAPPGFDWDDEASVRANLAAIRHAVGVTNFMPPEDPRPPCDERARLVRWIDAGAP